MLADRGANTPVKPKPVFFFFFFMHLGILLIIRKKTVQVLFTGADIPLRVGKGNQQHSQEILTTKDKRAQTERQTFIKVSEEWQKKKKRHSTVVEDKVKTYLLLLVFSEGIQAANDKSGARVHPSRLTCKPRPVWGLHTHACAKGWIFFF